jgi:hypothetical protein
MYSLLASYVGTPDLDMVKYRALVLCQMATDDVLVKVKRLLFNTPWLWLGDRFVGTHQVAFDAPENAKPYLFQVLSFLHFFQIFSDIRNVRWNGRRGDSFVSISDYFLPTFFFNRYYTPGYKLVYFWVIRCPMRGSSTVLCCVHSAFATPSARKTSFALSTNLTGIVALLNHILRAFTNLS